MKRYLLVFGLIGASQLCLPVHAQEDRGLGAVVDKNQAAPAEIDRTQRAVQLPVDSAGGLSLTDRIAQLMMVTLEGVTRPSPSDRTLIKDFPPGGVIIPKIHRPQDAADYIAALRSTEIEIARGIPLLIGTDFYTFKEDETRPIELYLNPPPMLSWAAGGASDSTQELSRMMAADLRVMGFNLHFGPSFELSSELSKSRNSVYNFGGDPKFLAAMADEIASATAESGLIFSPRGFPGGGQSRTEISPGVLLTPKSQLRGRDLLPYEHAIEAGAQMLHVGNTLVPTLDKDALASLSPYVMRQLIRDILDFEGVVVAGPMDAPEVSRLQDTSVAAVLALQAGADMLYWNSAGSKVIKAIGTIAVAVNEGVLEEAVVNDAFQRVIALKQKNQLDKRGRPNGKVAAKLIKERKDATEPYLIDRRGVTLVKNSGNLLPLTEERSMPIYVTGAYGVDALANATEEYVERVLRDPIRSARHIDRIEDFELDRIEKFSRGVRTVVCVLSDEIAPGGQRRLLKLIKASGARLVVVYLGYPSKLRLYTAADAIVLVYADPSDAAARMTAVADLLMGNAPIEILPAFRDLERAPGQESTFDVFDVIRSPVGRLPVNLSGGVGVGFSVSYRPILEKTKVMWDFGDGKTSKDHVASHAYKVPGRYEVTLTIEGVTKGEKVSGTFGVVVK